MVLVRTRTGRVGRRHIFYSSVAQSVEHLTVNQAVTGSSPVRGAKIPIDQTVYGYFSILERIALQFVREPTR